MTYISIKEILAKAFSKINFCLRFLKGIFCWMEKGCLDKLKVTKVVHNAKIGQKRDV